MTRICQPLRFVNPMTVARFGNMSMLPPNSCCQTSFSKKFRTKMGNVSTGASLGFKRNIIVGHFHSGPVSGLPISVTIQKSHRHNVYHTSFTLFTFKKGVEYFYTMNQATHNNDIRRGSRDHLLINKVRVRSSSFISRRQLYVISQ